MRWFGVDSDWIDIPNYETRISATTDGWFCFRSPTIQRCWSWAVRLRNDSGSPSNIATSVRVPSAKSFGRWPAEMGAQVVVILWRDIPAHVNAQMGRTRAQVPLSPRFQRAIDRAAMVAGLTNSHDYVNEWRRVSRPCSADLEISASQEAAELEGAYDDIRLEVLAEAGGVEGAPPQPELAAPVGSPLPRRP